MLMYFSLLTPICRFDFYRNANFSSIQAIKNAQRRAVNHRKPIKVDDWNPFDSRLCVCIKYNQFHRSAAQLFAAITPFTKDMNPFRVIESSPSLHLNSPCRIHQRHRRRPVLKKARKRLTQQQMPF